MTNEIKILGAFGGKSRHTNNTCIQIQKDILIDAGNILNGLGDDAKYINHIFLTHSHLDHINDIPFLIDTFFEERELPLCIYGLKETIKHLNEHIFNWDIWPDFCEINLMSKDSKAVNFVEIEPNDEIVLESCTIKAIKTNHTTSSCGYVVTKNDCAILFSSDTYCCDTIWEEINTNLKIKSLIIDVSFPSRLGKLAFDSKHLTPELLKTELKKLIRDDIRIYIYHLKPNYIIEIMHEMQYIDLHGGRVLGDDEVIHLC